MRLALFSALAFVSVLGGAHASSYSAVGGFSKKVNPNGPWSYLGAGTLLAAKAVGVVNPKVNGWASGQQPPNNATIIRNQSGANVQDGTVTFYPDHLNMDPESFSDVSVHFIAPLSGSYVLSGDFKGGDTSEHSHPVGVLVNGTSVFSGTIASYGQVLKFRKPVTLNAGDTVDFVSMTNGWTNLSTGLKATITSH